MSNYVIAIGGTGIRVLRSIVHLCDCGHIDVDELKVLIIDPDLANGSRDAVRRLIADYNDCRGDMQGADDKKFPLFKTRLTEAIKENLSLTPVTGPDGGQLTTKYHIKDLVSRGGKASDAETNFMKALYSHEEYAELDMSEGFFAHPSIGALAFARWLENSDYVRDMLENMRHDIGSKGEDVNVFIVASSFGGTGASGFPSVASKIKKALKDYPDKFHIAGAFLLPYFSFMRKEEGKQILDPKKFLEGAKNAMVYYREYRATEAFDKVYVLGAPDAEDGNKSLRIIRNKYADKGAEQDNWPHVVELFAALAAKECFATSVGDMLKDKDKNHARNWVGISLDKASFFDMKWSDLPYGEDLRKSLSKFLLFNYIFIPAVLNEFMQRTSDGLKKKTLDEGKVNWPSITRAPFTKGREWDEKDFGDNSDGLAKFKRLLKYFNGQAIWLYRLLTEYEHEADKIGKGGQLFNGFFVHGMLKDRYLIAQAFEKNEGDTFSEITKKFIKNSADNIGAGKDAAFLIGSRIAWSAVYSDIFNCVHNDITKESDINVAIRQLLQSVFNQVAKRIR